MVSQQVLVQVTAGRELLRAQEAGELYLLDLPLLHLGMVELDMTGHLTHVLTNEHAVFTQLAPHPPEQTNMKTEIKIFVSFNFHSTGPSFS